MQNEPKKEVAKPLNPIARHNARSYVLQALYQWHINQTGISDLEKEFITYHIKKPIDTFYFKELLENIPQQVNDLNEVIKPLINRAFVEIDTIELIVLQIAIYELKNRLDVPYRVVINEALELTKKFGSIEGYKFVNGLLDKISKQLRQVEIGSQHK